MNQKEETMNQNHLQQIFSHYIEKFEEINNPTHNENYKWQVANEFRKLMDEALSKDEMEFAEALYAARAATNNIIDNYTQPFYGLVEFARKEPKTVKQMFLDLYSDDGGDLQLQQKLIADFFNRSNELLEKYFPGSHLYKQDSHSVSAYLFLYDPDHHYMYKATQAGIFADCIEFFDEWGTGDNIKLEAFYRMCDGLVEEIKKNEALIATDRSRFDGRFKVKPEDMFEDKEKHMLVFDIIYCCSVYNLFDGITFSRPKAKEKQFIIDQRNKVQQLLEEYNEAMKQVDLLKEAKKYLLSTLVTGTEVKHKAYGVGTVESIDAKYITVFFPGKNERKQLGLAMVIANGIIKCEIEGFEKHVIRYNPVLKREVEIDRALERAKNALKPYEKYLD